MDILNLKLKNKRSLFFIVVAIVFSVEVYSQQHLKNNLYMFTPNVFNPAASGTRSSATISGSSRNQWWGLSGAPAYVMLSLSVPWDIDMGMGTSLTHFSIGSRSYLNVNGDFSYKIKLSDEGGGHRLSLGARWSFNYYDFNPNDFSNIGDIGQDINLSSVFSTNFGLGAFLYSYNYYVTLSSLQLFDIPLVSRNVFINNEVSPILYLGGGYVFSLNKGLKFRPEGIVYYYSSDNSINYEGNLAFMFANKFWVGGSYKGGTLKDGGDFGTFFLINLTTSVKIGYAYEYSLGEISELTKAGTHEFMVIYQFSRNAYSKTPTRSSKGKKSSKSSKSSNSST